MLAQDRGAGSLSNFAKALTAWDGRHARQVLEGLGKAALCACLAEEIRVGAAYLDHPRSRRKAAKAAGKSFRTCQRCTGGRL
jgi:hypothetical protein